MFVICCTTEYVRSTHQARRVAEPDQKQEARAWHHGPPPPPPTTTPDAIAVGWYLGSLCQQFHAIALESTSNEPKSVPNAQLEATPDNRIDA